MAGAIQVHACYALHGFGLYKYIDKVRVWGYTKTCMVWAVVRVWAVDKYVGVMQRRACSRRIASASGEEVWGCGAVDGVGVHVFAMRL